MKKVWCVRGTKDHDVAGSYAKEFVKGGFIGIGFGMHESLVGICAREEIEAAYCSQNPSRANEPQHVGIQTGQIHRFVCEMNTDDYVITPAENTDLVYVGIVDRKGYYFVQNPADECHFKQRRHVDWFNEPIARSSINSYLGPMTVFQLNHVADFLKAINQA